MNLLPFAFTFPEWRCADCRTFVAWADAILEEESGRLVAVRCGCVRVSEGTT